MKSLKETLNAFKRDNDLIKTHFCGVSFEIF